MQLIIRMDDLFIYHFIIMQAVKKFLNASEALIENKQANALGSLTQELQKDKEQITILTEQQSQIIETQQNNSNEQQKVLEIDVIQSSYFPNPNQFSEKNVVNQKKKVNSKIGHHPNRENSHIERIQAEKKGILEQLKKIDEQIAIIKGDYCQDVNIKRKQKELEQQKAIKQAKDLVKQLKKQKKEQEERKKKEYEKNLLQLKQQEQEQRKKRDEHELKLKQQKRKAIQQRIQQQRRKRQERKQIDKESNKLLAQLKKQQQIVKMKEAIPLQISQVEQKAKIVEKRRDVNFKEIEQHERKYILMKEQEKLNRRDRSQSQPHQIPKYQKNTWMEKLEEQEVRKKEQDKIKEIQRKNQLQKRLKYGQLVKNIFLPKKKEEKLPTEQAQKPLTPSAPTLPHIPESQKRVTESKAMKQFTENNRPFATSHSYKKPPRPPRDLKQQKAPPQQSKQDQDKQRQKKQKQYQMRKQTKQRLQKLENKSLDLLPQSKPKYENYLGQVKLKKKDQNSWKQIIDSNKLSKEQKYNEMIKKASNLQNRAKQKEQMRKQGDEEAINLYIGSIQAKLALLQKF